MLLYSACFQDNTAEAGYGGAVKVRCPVCLSLHVPAWAGCPALPSEVHWLRWPAHGMVCTQWLMLRELASAPVVCVAC